MKVAVMNYSGNVGKSTLTRHLLAPRMPNAELIAVETVNADDLQAGDHAAVPASEFEELQRRWLVARDVIVDVGASNIEQFVASMAERVGSSEDFDVYMIPTVPETKQQRDTLRTVDMLADLGVEPDRIRVVFNKVPRLRTNLQESFSHLYDLHRDSKTFVLDPGAFVYQSPVYHQAAVCGKSIAEICADDTDYLSLIENADPRQKDRYAALISLRRLALGVREELDVLFFNLMPGVPTVEASA